MSQNLSIWLLIGLAAISANLPFINQRLMTVVPLRTPVKSLAWRLAELVVWYFIVGGVGSILGSFLGAMAQAANDSPEVTPKAGDRATAASLGKRVASAAARWRLGFEHANGVGQAVGEVEPARLRDDRRAFSPLQPDARQL